MRVSNVVVVLTWIGLWFHAQDARAQGRGAPRALPKDFLFWPFSPNEQWRVTWSYDVRGASSPFHTPPSRRFSGIRYALDFQRVEGPKATLGSAVRAAAPGNVLSVSRGWSGGYGNTVVLDHGNGFATRYAHLDFLDPSLKTGMDVPRWYELGKAGNTGRSTGAHLHFEVRHLEKGKLGQTVPPAIAGVTDFADADYQQRRFKGPYTYTADSIPEHLKQELAGSLGKSIAELFGGKSPAKPGHLADPKPLPMVEPVELAEPKPLPGLLPAAKAAENDVSITLESITFVKPEGLPVARRWNDGRSGAGILFGGDASYLAVQRHPGFSDKPYTPDGVASAIVRFSWRGAQKRAVTVGKDALPGIHLAGPGGLAGVLFSHGGRVYMIASRGQGEALRRVVESVSVKK